MYDRIVFFDPDGFLTDRIQPVSMIVNMHKENKHLIFSDEMDIDVCALLEKDYPREFKRIYHLDKHPELKEYIRLIEKQLDLTKELELV